jgi:hypothetical protein
VVFRRLLERERIPLPWHDLVRVCRGQELRGELRGGRFVQRFAGEQFALPEAVELMRRLRRLGGRGAPGGSAAATARLPAPAAKEGTASGGRTGGREPAPSARGRATDRAALAARPAIVVAASDPLNLDGILTPAPRVPARPRRRVQVA